MDFESITLAITGAVAVLTLNRPETLNAITPAVGYEINAALDEITASGSPARCLLITGAGRGFSSGADLKATQPETTPDGSLDLGAVLERCYNPLIERLAALPLPIVTAVNGPAAGIGCSLALAGDIVIAAQSAYFLQAFVNIGLVPDGGITWLLPRLVGKARAQAMLMLGDKVSAETARDWGMVYKVVEDTKLMDEAMSIADRLSKGPTRTYGLIRDGIRHALECNQTDALRIERENQRLAGLTSDVAEGVAAFLEKRRPLFTGR